MLKLFLWLRYLRKRRIVFLSITAVALSVSLLMVIASGFTGFIKAYKQIAVDFVGDIVLQPPKKFPNSPVLLDRLEQLGAVEAAEATLSGQGVLYLGKGNVRAVHIQGIDLARAAKVTAFKSSLLRQKDSPEEPSFRTPADPNVVTGFVGIAVVREPDEETDEYDFEAVEEIVGKSVVLTTGSVIEQKESSSPPGETQFRRRTLQFTVADIVFTGVYQVDKKYIFLPIERLQNTLYPEQEPVAELIQIKLSLGADVESARTQIRGVWQEFVDDELGGDRYLKEFVDIETAVEMQSQYVEEIRKQMGLLLLIIGVVSASVV